MRWATEHFAERFTELRRRCPGWTYAEIAEEMDMSYKALDMAVRRARKLGYYIPPAERGNGGSPNISEAKIQQHKVAERVSYAVAPGVGWQDRATCREVGNLEIFFPSPKLNRLHPRITRVVDEYCSVCPVKPECLASALSDPTTSGIWGGYLLPNQIKEIDTDKLLEELRERNL